MRQNEEPRFLRRNEAESAFFVKNSSRAFFLAGSDAVAIKELERSLIEKIAGLELNDTFRIKLDADECGIEELNNSLMSVPLFGGNQVVSVSSAESLTNEKKFEGLLEKIKKLDESVLLIMKTRKSVPARQLLNSSLVKYCAEKRAAFYGYAPNNEREAVAWVTDYCRRKGYRVTADAAARLVTLVGMEPGEIVSEVEKIALNFDGNLTKENVEELLVDHRERAADEWAEAILQGEARSVALAAKATNSGREGILAISILFSKLMELESAKSGEQVVYFRRAAVERAMKRWNSEKIGKALEILLELDINLKSKPQDGAIARIELATLKLLEL